LQKAGIVASAYNGQQLAFTSADTPFQVEAGDVMANALMGNLKGTAGTALATSVSGVATAGAGTPFVPTNVTIRITGGSLAAPVDITLDPASTTTALAITDLSTKVNGNAQLQAAGISVSGTAGAPLTFTGARWQIFSLEAAWDTADALGLGSSGSASASPLTVAKALNNSIDTSGCTAVSSLSFAGLADGNDSQTITVSAADPMGTLQTATITLRNNAQGREGRSIDESIGAINAQLQRSGGTLQQIVAVKENVGGAERIGFLSSLRSFNMTAGNEVNGEGLNGGVAVSEAAAPVGALINVSVTTRDGAMQALTAIAGAVNALGATQAVVGKAENQLNAAIDLSQSQLINFSSAESRIRDTDVASDAANLTKSQILMQAGVATMAQANSAAQAVLALLKG
jgi:flagellin